MTPFAAPAASVRSRDISWKELFLAGGAIGLIVLHVLDDNFFQPQPGTSAGDHLVSGLVPTVMLLGVAALYPRLRAGGRGATALLLGVLGIAIGAGEAGYYTLKGGPSGDDYTGLIALVAGFILVGLGAVVLWTSRRREDGLLWRYSRRLMLTVAAVLLMLVIVVPFSLTYALTHSARTKTTAGNLGAPYESVAFTTSDGLRLKGWYVPSKNGAAVVVFPGKKGTQRHARMLVRHGYGVLVFDRRGEGTSEGDPNAFGWAFNRDLKASAAFLQTRRDVDRDRIGGIGLSVGGEMLLQTAAESKLFKAVVSDGAGGRSYREDLDQPGSGKWLQLPSSLVITAGTALFSNQGPPPNLKSLVPRIAPTPVFFIHVAHGAGGEGNNPQYYAAAGKPKQIWRIPDASHTHGLSRHPKEYERRVVGFFDEMLLKSA
jgi:uncharacterized protein